MNIKHIKIENNNLVYNVIIIAYFFYLILFILGLSFGTTIYCVFVVQSPIYMLVH